MTTLEGIPLGSISVREGTQSSVNYRVFVQGQGSDKHLALTSPVGDVLYVDLSNFHGIRGTAIPDSVRAQLLRDSRYIQGMVGG